MDHRIYGKLPRTDLGVYGTRRYPKGVSGMPAPSEPARIENRNPIAIDLQYGNSTAGAHAQTERWRYQVPRNRKAHLITAGIELSRIVAGAAGQWNGYINLKRATSPTTVDSSQVSPGMTFLRATSVSATAGSTARDNWIGNQEVLLFEGDILVGSTAAPDAGPFYMLVYANLIEFDATEKLMEGGGSMTFTERGNPYSGGALQQASAGGGGSYRTIIRVEGGSGPFYTATGWTDLGGGYYGRN